MENIMTSDKPSTLKRLLCFFTEHPREAGETYFQHLCFAFKMAAKLIGSGLALGAHGLFPFLFVHTASKTIRDCHGTLDQRSCKGKKDA